MPEPPEILQVNGRRELDRFIRLPWSVYASDPHWVAPLILERRLHLSPRNPRSEHVRWEAWLALQNGEPVGRITAQVDRLHLEQHGDTTGFFGMLEAIDDDAVFGALLSTAEKWLRARGMERVAGPFNLSINEECGLLVEGFDTPPSVMMGHSRPYYARHIESRGYVPAQDLVAYRVAPDFHTPPAMRVLLKRQREHVHVRPLNSKRIAEELELLRDIFNDAWSGNWGFVPFTTAEFRELGRMLQALIPDDFVQIAEVDGEPAAMSVVLPNVNEAVRDLDGHLLPFGWAKLLWRLKVRYPKTGRMALMGVRERYQRTRLGAVLAFLVCGAQREPVMRRGIKEIELSWILESNVGMRNIIEAVGGTAYKRYRIYSKALNEPTNTP